MSQTYQEQLPKNQLLQTRTRQQKLRQNQKQTSPFVQILDFDHKTNQNLTNNKKSLNWQIRCNRSLTKASNSKITR